MNMTMRTNVIEAMDLLVRCVNDENVFATWLMCGVADGDIEAGRAEDYIEDDEFAHLMHVFLSLMSNARKNGGLYCDRIVSGKAGR